MKRYPALCKVQTCFWNGEKNENHYYINIIYADSFTDAMQTLEDYYGEELVRADIELFEEGLITCSTDKYPQISKIMNGVD